MLSVLVALTCAFTGGIVAAEKYFPTKLREDFTTMSAIDELLRWEEALPANFPEIRDEKWSLST
jgi:hypothetical protein